MTTGGRGEAAASSLILDFDGTIVDTETALYRAWAELYARHGIELDLVRWQGTIGTDQDPDHWAVLESIVGAVDPALAGWRRRRRDELIDEAGVRPGVLRWLDDAERLGVPVGIASSSPPDWVEGHLRRLGLRDRFGCLACCDEVIPAKPDPTSYRHACVQLGAVPSRSVAVEDSPHGVDAAKAAGLFTVGVPHGLTADLDLTGADLVTRSLEDVALADVMAAVSAR